MVALDNAAARRPSQSNASPQVGLRGEEGLEMRRSSRGHTRAGVRDGEDNVLARRWLRVGN